MDSSVTTIEPKVLRTMPKYNVSVKRKRFYDSIAWKRTKQEVIMRERGICQVCGKRGTEVHHIIELNDENVDDPNIALNPDNLQLLCTSCHNQMRAEKEGRNPNRVEFTESGDVIIKR